MFLVFIMIYQCKCNQTTRLCSLMETNSDLCPESPTTINWLDLGLFWVTIIIITIIFLSPYLSQPLSSPQPDWVKVFISATVANIVLKKLNMQFWRASSPCPRFWNSTIGSLCPMTKWHRLIPEWLLGKLSQCEFSIDELALQTSF